MVSSILHLQLEHIACHSHDLSLITFVRLWVRGGNQTLGKS